jgi:hypothetical protein
VSDFSWIKLYHSIGSWNEETIKEFLLAKLKEGSPSKEKET